MPSLEGTQRRQRIRWDIGDRHAWRVATVGRCPPDAFIRQRLVERAIAKLQRDFRRADAIQADLKRAGVELWDVAAQVKGLVRWTATDGRSGPKPPSDSEIYDMMLAFEQGRSGRESSDHQQLMAEMTVSGWSRITSTGGPGSGAARCAGSASTDEPVPQNERARHRGQSSRRGHARTISFAGAMSCGRS